MITVLKFLKGKYFLSKFWCIFSGILFKKAAIYPSWYRKVSLYSCSSAENLQIHST